VCENPPPAAAVSPPPAALFLVLALPVAFSLQRLAIRHPGTGELGVNPELPLQPAQENLEVTLSHPVNQGLPQLRAVLEVEGRIFLVELVESRGELVLFAPHLHDDCGGRQGLGERYW